MDLHLHIGSPKTGTTAVQTFLAANREALRELAVLHPRTFGDKRHLVLPDLVRVKRQTRSTNGAGSEGLVDPESVAEQLQEELAERDYTKVLFSSEFFWTKLARSRQLELLRDFLTRFFDRIYIHAYIRRQDEYIASAWSTAVKGGSTDSLSGTWPRDRLRDIIDYWKILSPWAEVFGRESIICRKFDRRTLKNGDIIEDLLDAAGVAWQSGFHVPSRVNESLDADSLEFLRILNHDLPRAGRPRRFIVACLAEISTGPNIGLPDEDLDRFQATFAESNRSVAKEFFGGEISGSDDPLFLPRAGSRNQVLAHSLTTERAIETAAQLLQRYANKVEYYRGRRRHPDGADYGQTAREEADDVEEAVLQ